MTLKLPDATFTVTVKLAPTVASVVTLKVPVLVALAVVKLPAVVLPVTTNVVPTLASYVTRKLPVCVALAVVKLPAVVLPTITRFLLIVPSFLTIKLFVFAELPTSKAPFLVGTSPKFIVSPTSTVVWNCAVLTTCRGVPDAVINNVVVGPENLKIPLDLS